MESRAIVIHKGGKEEKYKIYVEDYVLSYLKYETGSLEFSEIYFFGSRLNGGRKYVIYGAGRDKHIPVFDTYDALEEIVCRLTQAGPVFMVREPDEVYQIKGFDVFYQDNGAMQSYMVEPGTESVRPRDTEKENRKRETGSFPAADAGRTGTGTTHSQRLISVQLGLILILLVAIVINSANSYDKMERLNRSAEEVFFAIENQEADGSVADSYEPGGEIVVERDRIREKGTDAEESAEHAGTDWSGAPKDGESASKDGENTEENGQDIAESGEAFSGDGKETQKSGEDAPKDKEETARAADEGIRERQEDPVGAEGTEALSRNVTRYYEVERGDTLYTICQKIYGDTSQVKKICELNDIEDPDRIRFGQKIILP